MATKVEKGRVKRIKKQLRLLLIAAGIALILVTSFVIYCESYYHADEKAMEAVVSYSDVVVRTVSDTATAYSMPGSTVGVIFYPGEKVETDAYAPLMCECAERGITCILFHMPGNMPKMAADSAASLKETLEDIFPEVESWFMAGHGAGGTAAAEFAANNTDMIAGLVLLGACPKSDISGSPLRVMAVRGSEDKLIDASKLAGLLPAGFEDKVIDGGCHSFFGMYGMQKGDGTPTITVEEQITKTAELMEGFVNN